MKDLSLLVWLTQFALSVVSPLVGCILLAVWLHNRFGWGVWIIGLGAALGFLLAIDGLRSSLKLMSRLSKNKEEQLPPPVSFNDHE